MTADPALLRKAADIIREGGLAKGTYNTAALDDADTGPAHCTVGALIAAEGLSGSTHTVGAETTLLADMLGLDMWSEVMNWNDADERTADDVITLLEQAAEKAEADR